jgi:hypothetical protein
MLQSLWLQWYTTASGTIVHLVRGVERVQGSRRGEAEGREWMRRPKGRMYDAKVRQGS